MLTLRIALRAIRWRAGASATVFVVAVVAILAATVGPIYLHAVDETVLAKHLNNASVFQRDVLVSRYSQPGFPGVDWDAQVRDLAGEVAHNHLFARPVWEEQPMSPTAARRRRCKAKSRPSTICAATCASSAADVCRATPPAKP